MGSADRRASAGTAGRPRRRPEPRSAPGWAAPVIVASGIRVVNRREIPEHLVPPDGHVELDAKRAAGYYSGGDDNVERAEVSSTVMNSSALCP